MNDSVFKIGANYYPRVLLEECKYIAEKKAMARYITDDLDISSDDSHKKISDEEDYKKLLEYRKNYSKLWKNKKTD